MRKWEDNEDMNCFFKKFRIPDLGNGCPLRLLADPRGGGPHGTEGGGESFTNSILTIDQSETIILTSALTNHRGPSLSLEPQPALEEQRAFLPSAQQR